MKTKVLFIFTLLIGMNLTSCDKAAEELSNLELLIGRWNVERVSNSADSQGFAWAEFDEFGKYSFNGNDGVIDVGQYHMDEDSDTKLILESERDSIIRHYDILKLDKKYLSIKRVYPETGEEGEVIDFTKKDD